MREHLRDGDVLLAILCELRPHACDCIVVAQNTAVDEHCDADCDDALRRGVDVEQRILAPRLRAMRLHVPGPQVDDATLAVKHGERGADFATVIVALKVRRKALAYRLEARRNRAGDRRVLIQLCAHRGLSPSRDRSTIWSAISQRRTAALAGSHFGIQPNMPAPASAIASTSQRRLLPSAMP